MGVVTLEMVLFVWRQCDEDGAHLEESVHGARDEELAVGREGGALGVALGAELNHRPLYNTQNTKVGLR